MTRVPLRDAPSGAHPDEAPPLAGAAGLRLAHPHDPAMRQVMATLQAKAGGRAGNIWIWVGRGPR